MWFILTSAMLSSRVKQRGSREFSANNRGADTQLTQFSLPFRAADLFGLNIRAGDCRVRNRVVASIDPTFKKRHRYILPSK
jgi:hypothetical protein